MEEIDELIKQDPNNFSKSEIIEYLKDEDFEFENEEVIDYLNYKYSKPLGRIQKKKIIRFLRKN